MRPIRNMLHILLVIGMGFSLTVFSNGPAQAQTAPGASRSILAFPRPGGFPNPALRVTYARADEAPPLMVRTGENTFEPLYRRTPDGGYAPARAAGYRIAMTSCPSITTSADYRSRMIDLAAAEWAYFGLPILDMAVSRFNAFSRLARELEEARGELENRKLIERAKGILMKSRGLTEDDAYALLRKTAMNQNRKIAEIAQSLVTAAGLLDPGGGA